MAKIDRVPDEAGAPAGDPAAAQAEEIKAPSRRSRRAAPKAAAPAQAETPPAAEPAALEKTAATKSSRRKKIRAPQSAAPLKREGLRTSEERLKELPELPSLQKRVKPESKEAPVDTNALPPPPPAPPPVETAALPSEFIDRGLPVPQSYGLDRLVALPRDPHWIYVYWELKGGELERLRFKYSAEVVDHSRWVLRVKTLRDLSQYLVDIDVRIGQWYLKVLPDSRFVLDLGFFDHDGNFVLVVQGNEVRTPRAGVSDVVDERWLILRDELEQLLTAGGADPSGTFAGPRGSEDAPRIVRSEQPRAFQLFSSYLLQKNPKS